MGNTSTSPKRQRFHRGYLLIAAILALVLYFGSLALFPDWGQSVSVLFALAVVVIGGVITFLSDLRTAFAPPPENAATTTQQSTTVSGRVDIGGSQNTIGGDVAGRDIIKQIQEAPNPLALNLHQLPSPPRDFTGRAADLDELLSDIARGAVISGMRGMGGIGKTALALVIAGRLKAQYPDAQFFIPLRGASDAPARPIDAMQSVIRAYHPTAQLPDDANQIAALYRSVLEGQRAIVLLDDAKDAAQITPLLPPTSCLALITTRHKFAAPGLKVKDLNVLTPDDARDLLIVIAPRLAPAPIPSPVDEKRVDRRREKAAPSPVRVVGERRASGAGVGAADEIARLCGCLPLALRAAASLLAATLDLNPAAFAVQLRDERTRLAKIGKEGVEIDVEASLNLSYQQLSPEAARVFRQLSVFPAAFDADAAEAVCEDTDHAHLSRLVRLSLVLYEDTTNRYSLHDLVRLFADALLTDDDRAPAQLRHAEHYLSVLRQAQKLYLQGNDAILQGLALFDREWPNIRAGHTWAVDAVGATLVVAQGAQDAQGGHKARYADDAARLCDDYPDAGTYVLDVRLHPRELIRWREAALAAARYRKDRSAEGVHLGNLGLAYAALGETRTAIEFYEQQLVIVRAIGDRRGEGNALGNLGIAYANLGETRKAIEFYEQQLVIVRAIGDRRGEGNALGNLGIAYAALGEMRKAIEFYEQALIIDREIGDRRGEGNALGNLGNAYAALGEMRKAIEFYEQALIIDREIGDRRGEGADLGNLGIAYANLGETRQAIEFYEQALIIDREIGDRRGEGADLGNLGNAYLTLGETRQAIKFYEQQLVIVRDIGDQRGEGAALGNLGNAYAALGETRQAIEFYDQALAVRRAIGDRRGEDNDSWNMALALEKLGTRAQAIAHAEAALKVFEAIEDPHAGMVRRQLAQWRGQS
jgi:tetratricopeptide (TPR) repeat protein